MFKLPFALFVFAGLAVSAMDNGLDKAANYVLGPNDQITLLVPDVDELSNKPLRVDMRGDINLPLAGRIHAAGLTITELEQQIDDHLRKFVKNPQVVASVSDYQSRPISVLGAVNTPGVRQVEGQKTLFEVLSLAGGLRTNAGNSVHITRDLTWGRIPLPNAKDDPSGRFSVASVNVKTIMNATNPAEDIMVKPHDIISVSNADLVYAVGSINKPGGFVLGENETISTLQVISLAEGLQKTAASDKAKILRAVPGSSARTEIPVNIKALLNGKSGDIPLKANDILFIPNSVAKVASYRTVEAIVQTAIGMTVYTRF